MRETVQLRVTNFDYIPPIRSHATTFIRKNTTVDRESRHNHIRDKISKLQAIPQAAQRTPEWYEFRHGLITASNLGKIFASEAQRNSLIYEKCLPNRHVQNTSTDNNTTPSASGIAMRGRRGID